MIQQIRSVKQTNHWLDHVINFITVHPNRRTQLGSMAVQLETAHADLTSARAEDKAKRNKRSVAVTHCQNALRDLSQYCGDARAVLSRRFARETIDQEILKDYELDAPRPNSPTSREWLGLTRELLKAESRAVASGVTPMAFPSAAELQAVLDTALKACADVDDVTLAHRDVADRLRAINLEVGELVMDTAAWFRFSLRRYSKPAQRDIMRRFGFAFLEGSSEEPSTDPGPVGIEVPDTAEDPPSGEPSGGEPSGGEPSGGEPSGGEPAGNATQSNQSGSSGNSGATGNQSNSDQTTGDNGGTPDQTSGNSDQTGSDSGNQAPSTTPSGNSSGDRDSDAPQGAPTETPPIVSDDGGGLDYGRNNLMDGNVVIGLEPSLG